MCLLKCIVSLFPTLNKYKLCYLQQIYNSNRKLLCTASVYWDCTLNVACLHLWQWIFFICFAFNRIKVKWNLMKPYNSEYSTEMLYLKINCQKGKKKGQISSIQGMFLFKPLLFITRKYITLVMLNFYGITFHCFSFMSFSQI